MQSKVYLKLS